MNVKTKNKERLLCRKTFHLTVIQNKYFANNITFNFSKKKKSH